MVWHLECHTAWLTAHIYIHAIQLTHAHISTSSNRRTCKTHTYIRNAQHMTRTYAHARLSWDYLNAVIAHTVWLTRRGRLNGSTNWAFSRYSMAYKESRLLA